MVLDRSLILGVGSGFSGWTWEDGDLMREFVL